MHTKIVENPFPICKETYPNTTPVTYPATVAQEVNLVVVIKRYRLVPVEQIDIGLVLTYRGKRRVDQEPVEFQQVLGWDVIWYIGILFLSPHSGEDKKKDECE